MIKNEETNPATGHTPGPWETTCGVGRDGGALLVVQEGCNLKHHSNPQVVCEVLKYGGTRPTEANARLMAAAPEMYEQLKALLEVADDIKEVYGLGSTWKNIRALVAKAEGGAS